MSLQFAPHRFTGTDTQTVFSAEPAHFNLQAALKRGLDLSVAIPLVLLILPVLVLSALAIFLESGGPVLFRQTRLGLNGKPFDILKFRSMSVAENDDRVVQASRGDERVTQVGRFLRATSIDELPQLFKDRKSVV